MKKVIFAVFSIITLATILIFFIIAQKNTAIKPDFSIVTTNFISYDLARTIAGDTAEIKMLISPGSDAHSFAPTPGDIIAIKNANLFIYTGGESDEWVENLLKNNEIDQNKIFRLMDNVELKTEGLTTETTEISETEYDEHVWTSIKNTIKITDNLKAKLISLNPKDAKTYEQNAATYVEKLQNIDTQITDIIGSAKRRELIFADRFPFRYFTDEYNLDYAAAFPGCSEQTEASSQTIAQLIDKVKQDNIPAILKIELTSDNLAKTIADATDTKILTLNAGHNISAEDFANGITYLDLLTANLETLKEALN